MSTSSVHTTVRIHEYFLTEFLALPDKLKIIFVLCTSIVGVNCTRCTLVWRAHLSSVGSVRDRSSNFPTHTSAWWWKCSRAYRRTSYARTSFARPGAFSRRSSTGSTTRRSCPSSISSARMLDACLTLIIHSNLYYNTTTFHTTVLYTKLLMFHISSCDTGCIQIQYR